MRLRLIALCLVCLLAGDIGARALAHGMIWSVATLALILVGGWLAADLDRLHREHIEVALTLSASSSIPQLRNRLAHERRQRSGRR